MENGTNISRVETLFISELWTSDVVILTILTLVTIYLATSLIYYNVRLIHSKNRQFSMLVLEKKFAVISKYICILIAVISVFRNANSIGLLIVEKIATFSESNILQINILQIACKILPKIGILILTVGTGLVYLFLWFRQRVFYVHPSISIINNKLVRAISWGIILAWFFYYISAMTCYLTLVGYQFYYDEGCLVIADGLSSFIYFYIALSWTIVSILMQIALLGLFIFPIIKRTLWRSKDANQHLLLLQRVKKAIIITVVCLISDILSALITWSTTRPNVTSFFGIYSINLLINHLATVACFDHWKLMLWPWKQDPNKTTSQKQKSDAISSELVDQKTKETNV